MIDNETVDEKIAEAGTWVILLMSLMIAVQSFLDYLVYFV